MYYNLKRETFFLKNHTQSAVDKLLKTFLKSKN